MISGIQQSMVIKEKGISHITGITADQIKGLLGKKYKDDCFIPECKNGETWGARDLLKLDAWCLLRTYSPLTTIGFEIKVSRADFENDQKWTGYLDLCHQFYFVCPAGLIRATDIPSRVGLMWVSSTGVLHTKRKPERVEPDAIKQNRLLIYALMSRSKIVDNMNEINRAEPKPKTIQYQEWLKEAEEKGRIAYLVKGHIRKLYDDIMTKEVEIKTKLDCVEDFKKRLANIGIVWDTDKNSWGERYHVYDQIALLNKYIDDNMLRNMKNVSVSLDNLCTDIQKYKDKG